MELIIEGWHKNWSTNYQIKMFWNCPQSVPYLIILKFLYKTTNGTYPDTYRVLIQIRYDTYRIICFWRYTTLSFPIYCLKSNNNDPFCTILVDLKWRFFLFVALIWSIHLWSIHLHVYLRVHFIDRHLGFWGQNHVMQWNIFHQASVIYFKWDFVIVCIIWTYVLLC